MKRYATFRADLYRRRADLWERHPWAMTGLFAASVGLRTYGAWVRYQKTREALKRPTPPTGRSREQSIDAVVKAMQRTMTLRHLAATPEMVATLRKYATAAVDTLAEAR